MTMKWFAGIKTVDELRQRYKELLKQYHPDNGGNLHIMQEINAEYDKLFTQFKDGSNADGQSGINHEEADRAFKEVLSIIVTFNITIEIIGSWIWCFDCYACKDSLKTLGFKYAPKKRAWTWHYGEYKRYGKEITLDDIRAKYGSQSVHRTSRMQCYLN